MKLARLFTVLLIFAAMSGFPVRRSGAVIAESAKQSPTAGHCTATCAANAASDLLDCPRLSGLYLHQRTCDALGLGYRQGCGVVPIVDHLWSDGTCLESLCPNNQRPIWYTSDDAYADAATRVHRINWQVIESWPDTWQAMIDRNGKAIVGILWPVVGELPATVTADDYNPVPLLYASHCVYVVEALDGGDALVENPQDLRRYVFSRDAMVKVFAVPGSEGQRAVLWKAW